MLQSFQGQNAPFHFLSIKIAPEYTFMYYISCFHSALTLIEIFAFVFVLVFDPSGQSHGIVCLDLFLHLFAGRVAASQIKD